MNEQLLSPNRYVNTARLHALMCQSFDLNELTIFVLELRFVRYDNLPGNTLEVKVHSLIKYAERHGKLPELLRGLKAERANVNWGFVWQDEPFKQETPLEQEVPSSDQETAVGYETEASPANQEPAQQADGRRKSVRWRIIAGATLALLVLVAGMLFARSGTFCLYRGDTDYETIVQMIRAESLAVREGNLEIITDIFAPDAYIRQIDPAGNDTEWFDPVSRYGPLFDTTTFTAARHDEIRGTVSGRHARFTSGSSGTYVRDDGYPGMYDNDADDPAEVEVWTLEKNFWGCWQITKFEFH